MNTQRFEAPSGIDLYNNINTWFNSITPKCPGMTSIRTQSVLDRLEKVKGLKVRQSSFIEQRRYANQEQKNIMSNLNILYKEIKYGKNYRDYVNNQGRERRRRESLSTPAPPPRSLSTPAPPTPASTDSFISPVSCFNIPEGYSLQYNHTAMKVEYEITGKQIINFNYRIIKD
tara:strand:- start:36 stop:554 length:519 start_codon:yes stop_codon:yes gene_type:complete